MNIDGVLNRLKLLRVGDTLIRRNFAYYNAAAKAFRRLEAASDTVREEWTRRRLAKILALASRTSYGQMTGAGLTIESWPLLDKATVQAKPAMFMSPGWRLSVNASTGGTTGTPLRLSRGLASIVAEQAALDLMMSKLGVRASKAKLAVLRADSIKDSADRKPPFWVLTGGKKKLVLSSHHLDQTTVRYYVEALDDFAPAMLWVYPTALEALCLSLKQSGLALSVPTVLASSEVLRDEAWHLAEATLHCRILDYYGQAERVAFAYADSIRTYRFLPGYAYIELIKSETAEEPDTYEIVGTSLWNRAMPLIRYRTGDLIRLSGSVDSTRVRRVTCGTDTFSGVIGRKGEFIVSPTGARITGINHLPRDVAHVRRIQVVQETLSDVEIRILPEDGFSTADSAKLMENVRAKLPPSMRVNLTTVATLEKSALGKTPFVIHRSPVREYICQQSASSN